jgi:hypothetical protein
MEEGKVDKKANSYQTINNYIMRIDYQVNAHHEEVFILHEPLHELFEDGEVVHLLSRSMNASSTFLFY